MLNSLPCSMLRKCLTARYAASNSLSKVEYFCWAASNFLLKKARGAHALPCHCCRTAPTCLSEASTARLMAA
jgi:hypothetical protein